MQPIIRTLKYDVGHWAGGGTPEGRRLHVSLPKGTQVETERQKSIRIPGWRAKPVDHMWCNYDGRMYHNAHRSVNIAEDWLEPAADGVVYSPVVVMTAKVLPVSRMELQTQLLRLTLEFQKWVYDDGYEASCEEDHEELCNSYWMLAAADPEFLAKNPYAYCSELAIEDGKILFELKNYRPQLPEETPA